MHRNSFRRYTENNFFFAPRIFPRPLLVTVWCKQIKIHQRKKKNSQWTKRWLCRYAFIFISSECHGMKTFYFFSLLLYFFFVFCSSRQQTTMWGKLFECWKRLKSYWTFQNGSNKFNRRTVALHAIFFPFRMNQDTI